MGASRLSPQKPQPFPMRTRFIVPLSRPMRHGRLAADLRSTAKRQDERHPPPDYPSDAALPRRAAFRASSVPYRQSLPGLTKDRPSRRPTIGGGRTNTQDIQSPTPVPHRGPATPGGLAGGGWGIGPHAGAERREQGDGMK